MIHDPAINKIPKVELHVHIEGTATPSLVKRIAQRNKIELPTNLFNENDTFRWKNFPEFLTAYDLASSVIRTPEDYRDITFEYLKSIAAEGAIYCELTISTDHALQSGLTYEAHLEGLVQGVKDAKAQFGIEARFIAAGVRHYGVEKVNEVVKLLQKNPHPWIVGFNLAGDEVNFPAHLFEHAYRGAREMGLGLTAHAGEVCGPESVRHALDLGVTRIGHGVRSIEDLNLISEIVEKNIVLECCPTSNIALNVYPSYKEHSLEKLKNHGVKATLNSDDPPFFGTTLGQEYHVAHEHFNFSLSDLLEASRTAIHASFAETSLKNQLLEQCNVD